MSHADPRFGEVERMLGVGLDELRRLSGGTHASTFAAHAGGDDVVIRFFPAGDDAARREALVLEEIADLGASFDVPRLISADPVSGIIVTGRVRGGHPDASLPPDALAVPLAQALAEIHAHPPGRVPPSLPRVAGVTTLAEAARSALGQMGEAPGLLGHGDYWCGNALWEGKSLTGVVDWNGGRRAPAGIDVAWCRQDLILLGGRDAADLFFDAYRSAGGSVTLRPRDLRAWDLHAAAHADGRVRTWAPNYAGIGRPWLTGDVLELRLAEWIDELLTVAS